MRKLDSRNDEIRSIICRSGVELSELDRLARIATEMYEIEWKLVRRAAAAAAADLHSDAAKN